MSAIIDLIKQFSERPIAFHRIYVTITGSVNAGLMLSQAMYWSARTKDPDGWFYKTANEWELETGMNRREQDNAREKLRNTSFWQEKRKGVPARMFFRIEFGGLEESLSGKLKTTTIEAVLKNCKSTLISLSKAGLMRAKKAGVISEYVSYVDVLLRDGMTCWICNEPITKPPGKKGDFMAFDHDQPISKGGTHTLKNIHPAHVYCNSVKCDKWGSISSLNISILDFLREAHKSAPGKQTTLYSTETTSDITIVDSKESTDNSFKEVSPKLEKEKKPVDPCFKEFVRIWCEMQPTLGFNAVAGKTMREVIIPESRKMMKEREALHGNPNNLSEDERTNGIFLYILNYAKSSNHWAWGKKIGTFASSYREIYTEILNGKQKPSSQKESPRDYLNRVAGR